MALHPRRSRRLVIVLALLCALPALLTSPPPAAAATGPTMGQTIVSLINRDRSANGLLPLRTDTRLTRLASDRAGWMATRGTLSHDSYGGMVFDAIPTVGISAWSSGEAIGSTTETFGATAADHLYEMWRASPPHWALIMSDTFNYFGVGVARQAGTGRTFAAIVFAEAPDASRPVASMTGSSRIDRTVTFTWSGRDGRLQTHTAGLLDFEVQYRVDGGPWKTIRAHTTTTKLTLTNRPVGHTYSVRVRDRDRRNNLSAWSTARTLRV